MAAYEALSARSRGRRAARSKPSITTPSYAPSFTHPRWDHIAAGGDAWQRVGRDRPVWAGGQSADQRESENPWDVPAGQMGKWYFGPTVTLDGQSVCVGFAGSVACMVGPTLFSTWDHGDDSAVQLKVFPNYHQTVAYEDEFDSSADINQMGPEALEVWAQQAQQRLTGTSPEVSPRQTLDCFLSPSDEGASPPPLPCIACFRRLAWVPTPSPPLALPNSASPFPTTTKGTLLPRPRASPCTPPSRRCKRLHCTPYAT